MTPTPLTQDDWYAERRKRLNAERASRGLEATRRYRDELRKWLEAGDSPVLQALRAERDALIPMLSKARARKAEQERVEEALTNGEG